MLCGVPLSPPGEGHHFPPWLPVFPQAGCVCSLPVLPPPTPSCPAQWGTGSPEHSQPAQPPSGLVSWPAETTFVPVSPRSGRAEVDDVLAAVRPNTCLVSLMLANNETGVVMVSVGREGDGAEMPSQRAVGRGEQQVPGMQPLLLPPARCGAEPAPRCPQPAQSSGGAAQDPGAHRCSSDDWQGACGCAGAGRGLPDRRGTQGVVALLVWPGC